MKETLRIYIHSKLIKIFFKKYNDKYNFFETLSYLK